MLNQFSVLAENYVDSIQYHKLHPLLVSVCQECGEHQVWRFTLEMSLLQSYCWCIHSIWFLHLMSKQIWLCSIWEFLWCWRHFIELGQKMVRASIQNTVYTGGWEDTKSSESQGREECAQLFMLGRRGDGEVSLLIRQMEGFGVLKTVDWTAMTQEKPFWQWQKNKLQLKYLAQFCLLSFKIWSQKKNQRSAVQVTKGYVEGAAELLTLGWNAKRITKLHLNFLQIGE